MNPALLLLTSALGGRSRTEEGAIMRRLITRGRELLKATDRKMRKLLLTPILRRRTVWLDSDGESGIDLLSRVPVSGTGKIASPRFLGRHIISRRRLTEPSEVISFVGELSPQRVSFPTNARILTVLKGVRVLARHGVAVAPGLQLIPNTLVMQGKFFDKLHQGKFSERVPTVRFDGPVAVLPFFGNHYINWREALTRVDALFEPEVASLPSLMVAYNDDFALGGAEVLRRILPKNATLVRIPRKSIISAPIIIDLPQMESLAFGPDVVAGLRRVFAPILAVDARSAGDVLYVRRSPASTKRAPVNEAALLPELERRGVRVVLLEEVLLGDQVRIFNSADAVVAQHGAGLSNLLMCRPGTAVLEVHSTPASIARQHYRAIAASSGLRYSAAYGQASHVHDPTVLPVGEILAWLDARG